MPAPVTEWHNDTYASISPSRPELSAKGKRIVVTGGGAGIGAEIVRSFAVAGATQIAILGRREHKLEATKANIEKEFGGVTISLHAADISKEVDLVKAAKEIGTWDVLVMNAGYLSTPYKVVETDMEDWWKGFEVSGHFCGHFRASTDLIPIQINIKGPALTVRAFIPTKGPEPVVLATSTMAVSLPVAMLPKYSSYIVSKLATIKLNEILQEEHPDVRFITVHPGVVETDMYAKSEMAGLPIDQSEFFLPVLDAAKMQSLIKSPVKLPADFAVWLASKEAEFLRGKFVSCNWDVDEMKTRAEEFSADGIWTAGLNL